MDVAHSVGEWARACWMNLGSDCLMHGMFGSLISWMLGIDVFILMFTTHIKLQRQILPQVSQHEIKEWPCLATEIRYSVRSHHGGTLRRWNETPLVFMLIDFLAVCSFQEAERSINRFIFPSQQRELLVLTKNKQVGQWLGGPIWQFSTNRSER